MFKKQLDNIDKSILKVLEGEFKNSKLILEHLNYKRDVIFKKWLKARSLGL